MLGYLEAVVLDIGSGTGGLGKAMQTRGGLNVVCADVENQHQHPDVRFVLITEGTLPFPADTFHASVFRFVLHHTPDPVDALRKASRVTKDGLLVVYEDAVGDDGMPWWQKIQRRAYEKHLKDFQITYTQSTATGRTYNATDWRNIVDEAGLTVVEEKRVHRPGAPVQRWQYVLKEAGTVYESDE